MADLLMEHDVPGVALAVMENGEITLLRGYGYADTAAGTKMSEHHVFNVASISKAVTAWGVLRLAERGELDLDRPVNTYLERWQLPGNGGNAGEVTARQLLSHTAGVSMPSTPGFRWPMDVPSLIDVLNGNYSDSTYAAAGTRVEVVDPPGRDFSYSGGAFLVLQLLVEELTGRAFQEHMQEAVLTPLGMESGHFGWTPLVAENMATPYLQSGKPEDIFRLPGSAASSLHASARDMAQFMLAQADRNHELRNRVISDEMLAYALQPVADTDLGDEELAQMGLGFFVEGSGDTLVAGHSGGNAGWRARLLFAPRKGDGIVLLINSDNGGELISAVSGAWLRHQGAN